MKHAVWMLAAGLAVVLHASSLQSQTILDKKALVTVVIPASVLTPEGSMVMGWPIYGVKIVRATDGQPVPNGRSDWRASGFPLLLEMALERVSMKNGLTEVEYRSTGRVIKFRMAPALPTEEMLRPFVINGPAASNEVRAYLADSYRLIASHVFTGELAKVPAAQQLALIGLAHVTANGVGLSGENYKGNTFLAVELSDDDNVYNTLKLNESQRLSQVMNGRLLAVTKTFAKTLGNSPAVYGIKLHTGIRYKSFLDVNVLPSTDDVSIYAPSELIHKFSDADITSQDFVDGCVVIVNGNRVKVVLAGEP